MLSKILKFFGIRLIFEKNLQMIIENYTSNNAYIDTMKELSLIGELKIFYDIGSNKGEWSDFASKIFTKSNFYLFEANQIHKKETNSDRLEQHFVVLSSKPSEVIFYSKGETGDSYFPEINKKYLPDEKRLVSTYTLDNYVLEHKLPLPDFIKIDTQGSELDIIRGGIATLNKCKYILIEISILEYNDGAPNFSEYIQTLVKLNYFPIKLIEKHYTNGILAQLDILFFRNLK